MLMLIAGIAIADDPTNPQRAIDATIDAPEDHMGAMQPTDLEKSLREAQNRRAMSNCLTSRGLSAGSCRQRLPNEDIPLSRAQARNLESRYRPLSARPGQSSRYPIARW